MQVSNRAAAIDSTLASELDALRRLSPFRALNRRHFDALCRDAALLQPSARVTLVREGVPPRCLHIVLEGCVELFAHAAERDATLGIVRTGGNFVLSDVVLDLPAFASARTCAASRLLSLPANQVRTAVERDRDFAHALLKQLACTQRAQMRATRDIKLRSALERLANRLLRYEREQGGTGGLVLPCDKRTLASLLAMTPENLSRAFASLGAAGVRVEGRSIALDDLAVLAALARADPLVDGCGARDHTALDT